MEVDFAGKTFQMVDPLTGEVVEIVVFVAVLPYSQYIYAEGMVSTKEPQWIAVNNNALVLAPGTHSHFESGKFSQFWPEPGTNPAQWVRLKTPFRVHPKQPN